MDIKEAITTLDSVIPDPKNKMVDCAHLPIAVAWKTVKHDLDVANRALVLLATDRLAQMGYAAEELTILANEISVKDFKQRAEKELEGGAR